MSLNDVFTPDVFGLVEMTTAVNTMPFIETAVSDLFEVSEIRTTDVAIEHGANGLQIVDPSNRGEVAPQVTAGRTRVMKKFSSAKFGLSDSILAADIQDIRQFGTETKLETLETVRDQKLLPITESLDYTEETLRAHALNGVIVDSAGNVIVDFFAEYGLARPEEIVQPLDSTSPKSRAIRKALTQGQKASRGTLGRFNPSRYLLLCSGSYHDAFVEAPEVTDSYARWQDGVANIEGTLNRHFSYGGASIVDYRGNGIPEGKARLVPVGVRGQFRSIYTPGDMPEASNTLGLRRYVSTEFLRHRKGLEMEVSTYPIHLNTRPESVITFDAGFDAAA